MSSTSESLSKIEHVLHGEGKPLIFPQFRSLLGQILIRKMNIIAQKRALFEEGKESSEEGGKKLSEGKGKQSNAKGRKKLSEEEWERLEGDLKSFCGFDFHEN
jgi:hypothetical protein